MFVIFQDQKVVDVSTLHILFVEFVFGVNWLHGAILHCNKGEVGIDLISFIIFALFDNNLLGMQCYDVESPVLLQILVTQHIVRTVVFAPTCTTRTSLTLTLTPTLTLTITLTLSCLLQILVILALVRTVVFAATFTTRRQGYTTASSVIVR